MSPSHLILAATAFPAIAGAANLSGILGPITPVYEGDETGTKFTKPGWFPDAQFPLVWGGANEPDTNLSWWMSRHSGGYLLDYTRKDGQWIPGGPADAPDERGYWIQDVYRPVDIDPTLRGRTVTLEIYPNDATYSTPSATEEHVIDDNYLVGFTHIEDWAGREVNGSRTIYSIDNGKNWKKGPLRAMSICAIDTRTDPSQPRLVRISHHWIDHGKYNGRKTVTYDIATGVDGYAMGAPNVETFTHGNMYGVTGMLWSRYLNKWLVMFGLNGSHGKDLQFVTTDSFETYSWEPSVSIERNEVPGRGTVAGSGDYPTLLGGFPHAAAYPMPFNKEVGQLGWIYNKHNGLSGRAIHFIAPVEKRITWQGADASRAATLRIGPGAASFSALRHKGKEVADLDDEDGDGVVNLMEYATGSPIGAGNKVPGILSREAEGFHFTYTRDTAAAALPVVEWSETLRDNDWRTDRISEQILSTSGSVETVRASLPQSDTTRRFFRLRANRALASPASGNGMPSAPVDFGNGVTLTLDHTEIPSSGGTATWTFTRSGPTTDALNLSFGVTGNASFSADYQLAGAPSFDGSTGTLVIPAGQASASFTTTATSGAGKSITVSAPGTLHLAGTGNWNQSGGGFSGIVDETHTLDFNSTAGGTFQNDIPVTKRVRSINFGAGSGDHEINGNPIELEAVNKWLSTGYAMYGINQYSAATATFNTDINTRSAALYLRPWQAGGKIVINGKTDMLGTGGVVVSGPGDVALNGDLVDTGYRDFSSGLPGLVAGVNMGRLIMAGDGTLSLAGDNTFNGRTEIKHGTVRVESAGALRNSIVTLKKHDALAPVTDFKLGGLDGWGNIDLAGHHLTLGNHNRPDCYTTNHTGVIRGDGSITKIDTNTQRLGAVNLHTGGTILKGGILEVPGSSRTAFGSGAIEFDGGTLRAAGTVAADNPVVVSSGGGTLDTGGRTVILNGALSGSGPLTVAGTGSVILNAPGTYTGTLSSSGEIRANVSGAFGNGVLNVGGRITLGADQTVGGLTVTADAPVVDTGAFTLTVNGPIRVAAGKALVKAGAGTLDWTGSAAEFNGGLVVNGGTFRTTGGGDVTHGDITLNGATLSLHSSATGNAEFSIARNLGTKLTVNGAARLILDKGTADTLTATIGSGTNADAFVIGEGSTFLTTLGQDTVLKLDGQPDTPANATYPPSFLLAAGDRTGDFAAYDSTGGFTPFTGYVQRSGAWTADSGEIPNITAATTLAADATVTGLRVQDTNNLILTSRVLGFSGADGKAGLILNNGSLTGGAIDFGTNKGYIYASGPDATISSAIRGSAGVIFTGLPGTKVNLTGTQTTYSTRLTVAGTTLELPSLAVMGESGTPITLDGGGTLAFPNSINFTRELTFGSGGAGMEVAAGKTVTSSGTFCGSGPFRKSGPGYLKLNGAGSSTGAVTVDEGTLEYISTAIQGSTGPISVAAGARVNISYTAHGVAFSHDLRIAGHGPNGEGALSVGGSGNTASSITLTDDARIQALNGATFAMHGPILGQGHALNFSGTGRFGIHGAIDVDGADLSASQTPYLSIKATSSVICENLTTAAGSIFERPRGTRASTPRPSAVACAARKAGWHPQAA
ncbi:autotransporter-associated beta strand repeat-containing protein [Luteolibacter sp. SL250]|uniref:beta strand repeat-containing protein n=1 Tax=Luteolibacter sp. SL250 TaxID=2995170 RepID=UPI0022704C80|nr:autotransporter-associated beta strand repeat-containing protein [Luteolibacter sp. SL250]WAC20514.1 autotransporter-associated beta strand repeat-containing protein [Luteolibacter sp. SL250]